MIKNPVLDTDAYKITHWMQRPENMTYFYNYGEPRVGGEHKEIMFFGLQYIIKEYFMVSLTKSNIEEGYEICKGLFGNEKYFPKEIWEKVWKLGYFPIKIRAVKEGTVLPVGNVCFTCESTEPWFAPMISHFEDYLMWCWYSCAIATRGFNIKLNLYKSFNKSADSINTDYAITDFGLRGCMFKEAAAIGGMAHLINFRGTDNIPAIYNMKHYYGEAIGESVWACYDDETEVLSEIGWKLFKNLDKETKVAQYDINGNISFVLPEKYFADQYNGKLINFKRANYIDLSVTPHHKMVREKNGVITLFESDKNNYNSHNNIVISGNIKHGLHLSTIDKLKIAFQADGSFPSHKEDYTGEKGHGFPIRFSLKRDDKHDRLLEYCNELDLDYSDTKYDDGYYSMWINVPYPFFKDFSWVKISEMSYESACDFINELQYWDGNRSSKNTISYYSTNIDCIDTIQEICAISGNKSYFTSKIDKRTDCNRKILYTLAITLNKNKICGRDTIKSEIDYSGIVYCVKVPSGMLVVRKNRKVCICGNTEHSVATVWGKDHEVEYVLAQLKRAGDEATVSIVIDSYDADNFIKNVMNDSRIKEVVINRNGRTVLRPDSGDPLNNMVKYSEFLGNIYGYHFNSKEYKVLNHNIGLIQGDGMDENSLPKLYEEYIKTGWSAENIVTGSGGGLLTGVTRDTDRWAIKVSYVEIDGKSVDVRKTPKTDMTKQSKAGKLKLHKSGHSFSTISSSIDGENNCYIDVLETVFENGKLLRDQTISQIREIAQYYFNLKVK
jgi:nicotinic acid phosphoribosyltransferase